MASRSRKGRRVHLWIGHALIMGAIFLGVTLVNHSCGRGIGMALLPGDAIRLAFIVLIAAAIAVSFSGKGPEGHA